MFNKRTQGSLSRANRHEIFFRIRFLLFLLSLRPSLTEPQILSSYFLAFFFTLLTLRQASGDNMSGWKVVQYKERRCERVCCFNRWVVFSNITERISEWAERGRKKKRQWDWEREKEIEAVRLREGERERGSEEEKHGERGREFSNKIKRGRKGKDDQSWERKEISFIPF